MRPTLFALGGFKTPLNQFADVALVAKTSSVSGGSSGALCRSKGALSESSSSEQTGGIDDPEGSSPPLSYISGKRNRRLSR